MSIARPALLVADAHHRAGPLTPIDVEAVECAWDPSCLCPEGTEDLGFYGDGYRRCDCPG